MNESEFQRKCDEFVSREVYCNVSTMAEYILKKSWDDSDAPFSNDDIKNPMQSGEIRFGEEWYEAYSTEELEELKNEHIEDLDKEKELELSKLQMGFEREEYTEEEYEEIKESIEEQYDSDISDLEDACNEAESQLDEYKEIFEYWVCSPWLISKLSDKNEAIIPHEQIWCRCTTGQSISIDEVIRDIVKQYVLTDEERASLKEN